MRIFLLALLLAAFPARAQDARAPQPLQSGRAFQGAETRAMQDDDAANPAMLWVAKGEALWSQPAGASAKACADCHGDARGSMRGVSARYPLVDGATGTLMNLEQRIIQCRVDRQQAPAPPWKSDELLALAAYVGRQSRGMPMAASIDGPARPYFEAGKRAYFERVGQLNLACTNCHDREWGHMLRGDKVSQGHGNGYPAYRLDWQTIGSLERRLRFCNTGVRAEPHPFGAPEWVALELYLSWRSRGLTVETPAVRR